MCTDNCIWLGIAQDGSIHTHVCISVTHLLQLLKGISQCVHVLCYVVGEFHDLLLIVQNLNGLSVRVVASSEGTRNGGCKTPVGI